MTAAFGWGTLAGSSLVIGALFALRFPISLRAIGLTMGFGAGVEAAGLDAGRGGEFAVAARESQGTGLRDERLALDAEVRPADGAETTGYDAQLDAAPVPVLGTREHQLGDAVQGAPGDGQ
jgi:hypothetical protein